jgi:GNAT superfamily N-acetyltransferase
MDSSIQRVAGRFDLQILRSELGERAWSDLARLLNSACTRPEWILRSFGAGALADVLVLAAPSEFNLPLEIIRLVGSLDARSDYSLLLQQGIETAKSLGVAELYCTVAEGSSDASSLIKAGFAFGEPTIGYIGVIPEHRGRNIASFLLSEAWSQMKRQGHSTLSAEADERNIAMHCLLTKCHFNRRPQKQEWRLEVGVVKRLLSRPLG